MTQRNIILSLCKSNPDKWYFSYDFCSKNTPFGWLGSYGMRRADELWREGRLEKVEDGQYVKYKYRFSDEEKFHLKMQNQ